MPLPPLRVSFELTPLHCIDEGDGPGNAEVLLQAWAFVVDAQSCRLQDFKLVGEPLVEGTATNVDDIAAGDDVGIEANVARFSTVVHALPGPGLATGQASTLGGVVGVLVFAFESDTYGAQVGPSAPGPALRDHLVASMPSWNTATADTLWSSVSAAAELFLRSQQWPSSATLVRSSRVLSQQKLWDELLAAGRPIAVTDHHGTRREGEWELDVAWRAQPTSLVAWGDPREPRRLTRWAPAAEPAGGALQVTPSVAWQRISAPTGVKLWRARVAVDGQGQLVRQLDSKSPWTAYPARPDYPPSVHAVGRERFLMTWVQGGQVGLQHWHPYSGGWVDQLTFPKAATGTPSAIAIDPDTCLIAVRIADGSLALATWRRGESPAIQVLAGPLDSSPVLVPYGPDRFALFARIDGDVLAFRQFLGQGWTDWEPLAVGIQGQPLVAADAGDGVVDLVAQMADGSWAATRWDRVGEGSGWSFWYSIPFPAGTTAAPTMTRMPALGAQPRLHALRGGDVATLEPVTAAGAHAGGHEGIGDAIAGLRAQPGGAGAFDSVAPGAALAEMIRKGGLRPPPRPSFALGRREVLRPALRPDTRRPLAALRELTVEQPLAPTPVVTEVMTETIAAPHGPGHDVQLPSQPPAAPHGPKIPHVPPQPPHAAPPQAPHVTPPKPPSGLVAHVAAILKKGPKIPPG